MPRTKSIIFATLLVLVVIVFGQRYAPQETSAAGSSDTVLTVLFDKYSPTNNKVMTDGRIHIGIAHFLVSAEGGDAEISSIDVRTSAWDAIFSFAIPGDPEYRQPVLYDETGQREISYTFSNLSWGSATLNFVAPLVIADGETRIFRVDAMPKRDALGEAAFELDNIALKDKNGNFYPILPSWKQTGNMFKVGNEGSLRTVAVSAVDSGPGEVRPGEKDVTLLSFTVAPGAYPVSIAQLWLVSDTPAINKRMHYSVRVRYADGTALQHRVETNTLPFGSTVGLDGGYLFVFTALSPVISISAPATVDILGSFTTGETNYKGRIGVAGLGFVNSRFHKYDLAATVTGALPIFSSFSVSGELPSGDDGLSLYLTFDGTLDDARGIAPKASSGVAYAPGAVGQAAKFNGYAEYANDGLFDESEGTVEALMKFESGYGNDAVIWHTDDSRYVLYYDRASDGRERRIIARAGEEAARPGVYAFDQFFEKDYFADKENTLTTNEWHHVAMTWHGALLGTVKLYVDGQLMSTSQYASTSGADTFRVGNNYGLYHAWNHGYIDELKLYTRARTDAEIEDAYDTYGLTGTKADVQINSYEKWGVFDVHGEYVKNEIPSIVGIRASKAAESGSVEIAWNTKSPSTLGAVFYRLAGEDAWRTRASTVRYGKEHSATLSGLAPGTYEYYATATEIGWIEKMAVSDLKRFVVSADGSDIFEDPGEDDQEADDGQNVSDQIKDINAKAKLLKDDRVDAILAELKELRNKVREQDVEIKYLRSLTAGLQKVTAAMQDRINNFITYGVDDNTKRLGEGERAAVMNSYKSAFNKLPDSKEELADAIKIANGRWPSERSVQAEAQAKAEFRRVYLREPDMDNPNDNAAVTVMAYGLRQRAENRNLNSERVGIRIFEGIYEHVPSTTEEWNIMQAITYSGTKR